MTYLWFFLTLIGMCFAVYLHFLSVEHVKFQQKYGYEKGTRITKILGLISGWSFFAFWFGIWISPQPRFTIPLLQNLGITIPLLNIYVPIFHLITAIPFIIIGGWLGISSVRKTSLKVAETHRTEKVISTGLYSKIRHPQYLGGMLAHIGITLLLSSFFSLCFTPLVFLLNYLISWKEEKELVKEFGKKYEDYMDRVPMFIPKLKKRKKL